MKKTKNERESSSVALNRNIKGINEFLSGKRGATFLIALFFILLIILVFSGKEQSFFEKESSENVEKRLAAIISKTEGVEKAEVMITYENQKAQSVAASSNVYSFGINNGKDETGDNEREIRGVIVALKGAEDYSVKINVISIISTALNVPASKIEVVNMK